MRRSFIAIALVVLVAAGTMWAAGVLDGRTFAGEVGEKGKESGDKDDLMFKDGRFRSSACEKYGFGDASYTAAVSGGKTTFEAETTSAKEGTMKWSGTVHGDTLTGKALWTKAGKTTEYWVKASLKK